MADIKRVLWVDDYLKNKDSLRKEVSDMFKDEETQKISSMDDAIKEISGEHLYNYDTIVLDIDFENGLINAKDVKDKLADKIYLSPDQEKDNNFIINNGGYLLFLYLLTRGYPSEQVAFLTGNASMIEQLQIYTRQNEKPMSKNDIRDAFIRAWEKCENDVEKFEEQIDNLPIDIQYRGSDFVLDCAAMLDKQNQEGLYELIETVSPTLVTGDIKNTGDMMIFRFHEANLESPAYFTKNKVGIEGHNLTDAKKWLETKRTSSGVARWLLLWAGDYIEQQFRKKERNMNKQLGEIFPDISQNGGIRSAFRQMYFVLDGLRNIDEHRGPYYQAISAMLVPFDTSPYKLDVLKICNKEDINDKNIRIMFAWCSKQARNFCAHNYFGSTISDETTMFLLMVTMTTVLNRQQREEMAGWYQKVTCEIETQKAQDEQQKSYDKVSCALEKIDVMTGKLIKGDKIDIAKAFGRKPSKEYEQKSSEELKKYIPRDFLYALGYNKQISDDANPSTRESYYVFTLAAYIVKIFDGLEDNEVEERFGYEVMLVYQIARKIVLEYEYPYSNV